MYTLYSLVSYLQWFAKLTLGYHLIQAQSYKEFDNLHNATFYCFVFNLEIEYLETILVSIETFMPKYISIKVKNILNGSLDSVPSFSPSVKI